MHKIFVLFTILTIFCLQTNVSGKQEKRILMHSDEEMAFAIQRLQGDFATLQNRMSLVENAGSTSKGSVYVRWGRTSCPANGTDLVYKGYAAGNIYSATGAADFICLTSDPLWGTYDDNQQPYSPKVYGTEYEFTSQFSDGGAAYFGSNLHDHDVPCSVCLSHRPTVLMIPGRNKCYPGWTLEYSGYLVSGLSGLSSHPSPSNYVCLDSAAESETSDFRSDNGKLMYVAEAVCGSLPCPPYVNYRELTCVVCSI